MTDQALSLSNLIDQDLIFMKEVSAKAKEHLAYLDEQIAKACEKLEVLRRKGGTERELEQLRKTVRMLKAQSVLSKLKIRFADANPRQSRSWSNDGASSSSYQVNENREGDGLLHNLYEDPKFEHDTPFESIKAALRGLSDRLKRCLLCFLRFPENAIIKKRTIIYWWIGRRIQSGTPTSIKTLENFEPKTAEDYANEFFDELIAKRFIKPLYKKCSLFVDSCRMHPSVRSALTIVSYNWDELECLLNVGEEVIDDVPQLLSKRKHMEILYLGRWQSSVTNHHIKIANTKIFTRLRYMHRLTFLCLGGISLITELPEFISQLTNLMILDLKACHNLEVLPEGIRSLRTLTHLDLSECYFLNHMPKGLASLTQLQVLKGFVIGHSNGKQPCNFEDLERMSQLRKLSIYTTEKDFPTKWHNWVFQKFKFLRKLTICWGGSSLIGESETEPARGGSSFKFPPMLEKLDLRGFPGTISPSWLRPANLNQLKKLYIGGGQLCNLNQHGGGGEQWKVEIMRLKYLSELEVDWDKLMGLFPELKFLEMVECPNLSSFPCDKETGVRMNSTKISRRLQAVERQGVRI